MKKRTIAVVSISLVLAFLAVAVIATFPSYLFEDETGIPATTPDVQSDNITESTPSEDVGIVGGTTGGTQGTLPDVEPDGETTISTTTTNLKKVASDDGAKLLAENGAFDKDVEFSVDKLGIFSKKYYRARHYVRDFAKNYTMYEITAEKDGKEVSPIGIAKVVIDIPEKYDINNVEVYYMLSDGGVQKLNGVINKDARTVTVSFMQSGVYILIERAETAKEEQTSSDTITENDETSSSTPSDTSSDTPSGDGSSDSSDNSDNSDNTSSDTSSDSTSSTESDPNQDTMDGWTPWY